MVMDMEIQTELAVIGAGPAGVCAAIAAARLGTRVLLVGDRPVLGGNSSSEIRVWTRGAVGAGNLYAEEMGVWGEMKLRGLYVNPDGNPVFWSEVLLDTVLAEPNLTLLLNTYVFDLTMKGTEVKSLDAVQLGSEKRFSIVAERYLDCTGDGSVGARAGVPYLRGKEDRTAYGESYAPEQPSTATQGNSLLFFVKKTTEPVSFIPPAYAYPMERIEALINRGGRVLSTEFSGSDYWWFEYGGSSDTVSQYQEITLELKRLIMGVWNYIKNSGRFDADRVTLEWFGSLPGKRESRRMHTDYILTQDDIVGGSQFPDGAFYGGWYIDFHPENGIYAQQEGCEQIAVNCYQIPLGCLYSSAVPNLQFAGRNIGASHVAFASSRVMNTCALSGQASGTLAAYCLQHHITPTGLKPEQVAEVCNILLRNDMFIPGKQLLEQDDLVPLAKITASSTCRATPTPNGWYSMEQGGFLLLPQTPDRRYRIRTRAAEDTMLELDCCCSPLPSRLTGGSVTCTVTVAVPAGEGYTLLPLQEAPSEGFLLLRIAPRPGLEIGVAQYPMTGLLMGRTDRPEYVTPWVELDSTGLYAPENIANGYARPYNNPNLWVSGKEAAPTLTLDWAEPHPIGSIHITLNPDLSMEIPSSRAQSWSEDHKFAARKGMPSQLVRSLTVTAGQEGEQTAVATLQENWKRLVVIIPETPVITDRLTFTFGSTFGANSAEVFEIRVYPHNKI